MLVTNNNLDFFLIARSGQCFRMHAEGDTVFLRTGSRFLTIHDLGQGVLDLSCTEEEFPFWSHYLDLHGPYARAIRAIPPEDTYLLSCVSACRGLHLLRQDPFETLISFILSQRKSIPAIEQCVEKLCMLCGEADDSGVFQAPIHRGARFPGGESVRGNPHEKGARRRTSLPVYTAGAPAEDDAPTGGKNG